MRRSNVWLTDNLNKRNTSTVKVYKRVYIKVVNALSSIFFHVNTRDADVLDTIVCLNLDTTMVADWISKLRYLISLREVRIEVVLAGEGRPFTDRTVRCKAHANSIRNEVLVEHWECSRVPKADGTDVHVGLCSKVRWTGTKRLRRSG